LLNESGSGPSVQYECYAPHTKRAHRHKR
jgi:hypothetical protein